MTIRQALANSMRQLKKASIASPHLDGEILLSYALRKPKEFLYAHPEYEMSKERQTRYDAFLRRRIAREPIAYITNKKEFYGYDFYVDKRVLIPRPETEELVQSSKLKVKSCSLKSKIIVVDIGTGSGCIIISLVKELLKFSTRPMVEALSQIKFYAIDISADALAVAKINAKKHKVEKYIKFYHGDLLEPIIKSIPKLFTFDFSLPARQAGLFTFIIANLPYVTPKQYLTLASEIKKYEPKLALLTPKNDADYYYRKLNKQLKDLQRLIKIKIYKFYEKTN